MNPKDPYIGKLISDPELRFKILDYIEGIKFDEQCRCAYAAAELLFLMSDNDCSKSRAIYEEWEKTDEGKDPVLEAFSGNLFYALDAIEHREGQERPLMSWCDLTDMIEKANKSNE